MQMTLPVKVGHRGCVHNPWVFNIHWSYKVLCASGGRREVTLVNNRFCTGTTF